MTQTENDICYLIEDLFYFIKEAKQYKDEYWYKCLKEDARQFGRAYPQWKDASKKALEKGIISQSDIDEVEAMKWD